MSETALIELDISSEEQKEICEDIKSSDGSNPLELDHLNLRGKAVRKKPTGSAIRKAKQMKLIEENKTSKSKRPLASPESAAVNNNVKRSKEDKKSYSDILKGIEVVIRPVNYPETLIDEKGVQALESLLLKKIDSIEIGGSSPQFHQRRLVDGCWKIKCIGSDSKEWLENIIKSVCFRGNLLELIDADMLTRRPKCRIFIPGECCVDSMIMHRLKVQNPSFDFRSWRIVSNKRQLNNDGRLVVFELAEESVKALANRNWYLSYGLTQVKSHKIDNGSGGNNSNTDNSSVKSNETDVMECDITEVVENVSGN